MTPQPTVANREHSFVLRPSTEIGHDKSRSTSFRTKEIKHVSFRPNFIRPVSNNARFESLHTSDSDPHYFRLNRDNLQQCEIKSECIRLNSPRRWVSSLPDGYERIPENRQPSLFSHSTLTCLECLFQLNFKM